MPLAHVPEHGASSLFNFAFDPPRRVPDYVKNGLAGHEITQAEFETLRAAHLQWLQRVQASDSACD